jgi:hypothetical protein
MLAQVVVVVVVVVVTTRTLTRPTSFLKKK